ncbi:DegT/DnrJ/EryC1/StrS family aminotransferase [Eleftheria terrae]|uniref:DegT/DnrJ/EryC1/StrS family aminotransferase n=1 Tax=Eleftheria terrae TaxID=1597781 RepID=UPI00263B8832|nr:DegT/DnrJ/EryC1/StrS family aminotransferase [Eleftheria terrae]WKB55169.1 DegT/DnrJ/EryC1/StrS family aminotransferase [Eleftheria terrae]
MDFIDLKTQYAVLKDEIDRRIRGVLEHGQYIMGPEVAELEDVLARFAGARHCVTVASGTEALLIALMALDVKPGDEIITSPFTFIATAEVMLLLGAKPVFVDIEPDTCNMDVRQVEAAITPRTRALMPVSLYGQPCDMDELDAIARRHGLVVIEDAAQSFGAEYKGRKSGHLSAIGCTSFFPSKPLGCYGDGGALFTDDDAIAQAAREIRVHGQSSRYHHTRLGVGGRMDTLQCAVVLAKFGRFEWEVARRLAIGERYNRLLDQAGIPRVTVRPDRTSVFAQYTVLVNDRARVQEGLKAAGVPTAVHYPVPIPLQPAYRLVGAEQQFPHAVQAAQRVISLPMHADLSDSAQDAIVEALVHQLS